MINRARVAGRLQHLRQRWTPDGSAALVAELVTHRPRLGPARASAPDEQPLPLRALGPICQTLARLEGRQVVVEGVLRRRYYRHEGEHRWGQVELWIEHCEVADAPKLGNESAGENRRETTGAR
ncbi:MAG: hypothetical protein R8K47_07305 [Mariprofundaceae bacterium]